MIIIKKIAVILVFAVLVISSVSSAVPKAIELSDEPENLIINGGFENGTVGWSSYGSWGNYTSVLGEQVHSGTKALKLSTDTSNNPWVNRGFTDFYPGTEYEVTAWVNTGTLSGSRALFKIETYNAETVSAGESLSSYNGGFYSETNGGWTKVTFSFIPENECRLIILFVRLYAVGTIYVDDVEFKRSGPVKQFILNTDNYFYYSDWDKGRATVQAGRLFPEIGNGSASFWMYDGEQLLDHVLSVPFIDLCAEYVFDVDLIPRIGEEVIIKATVYDGTGNPVGTETIPIYKYHRPTFLDQDGNYIVNGESFNPVFSYHHPEKDYDYAVEAGINVVQAYKPTSGYDSMLDNAYLRGIKVMFPLYPGMKPPGSEQNIDNTNYYVSRYKNHPALFGWMIMDEPFWNDCTVENLIESYKLIKSLDSTHPIIITEPVAGNFYRTAKFADILLIDSYPGNSSKQLTSVGEYTQKANEVVNHKKPVYTLLQTFYYQGYMPSSAETKQMIYQALMQGAKGVGYYCFEQAVGDDDLNATDIWPTLTGLKYDEWFGMFNGARYTKTEHHTENYHYSKYKFAEYRLHLLLNKTNTTQSLSVIVSDGQLQVIEGKIEDISVNGRNLLINIPPASMLLLKEDITGDNTNFISNGGFEEGLANWSSIWYGQATGETAHEGNACLKLGGIEGKGGYKGSASQKVVLSEGVYKLSFVYKNMLQGWNSLAIPIISINGTEVWKPQNSPGDWAHHEVYFTAAENEEITIGLASNRADHLGIYFDDISLTSYNTSVSFMDADYQRIDSIGGVLGGSLKALITPGANIEGCKTALAIYELKDGSKKLVDIKTEGATNQIPMAYGEGTCIPEFYLTLNIPGDEKKYIAEVIIWDTFNNMKPYIKKRVLN